MIRRSLRTGGDPVDRPLRAHRRGNTASRQLLDQE